MNMEFWAELTKPTSLLQRLLIL